MSQPWVLSAKADTTSSEAREMIARAVSAKIADDLYVRIQPIPRAYIDEAGRFVAAKTHEYVRWLEGVA